MDLARVRFIFFITKLISLIKTFRNGGGVRVRDTCCPNDDYGLRLGDIRYTYKNFKTTF